MRGDRRRKNDGNIPDRVAGDAWIAARAKSTNARRDGGGAGADPSGGGGVRFEGVVFETAAWAGAGDVRASGARENSGRHAGRVHIPGTGDANRPGGWKHAVVGGGSGAQVGGKIFRAAGSRASARKIPESGGADGIDRRAARRHLDDGGEIRGIRILQGARGNLR